MQSIGFNTVILSNNDFSDNFLEKIFPLLKKYGFNKAIFTLDYDVTLGGLSIHLENKKNLLEKINSFRPSGFSVKLASNLLMTPDSVYEKDFAKMSIGKSNFVCAEFPIFDTSDWIDKTLNCFLYNRKKSPVFMSFHKNLITYDNDYAIHIMKTRSSLFMLDMYSMITPAVIPYIKQMISHGAIIIPGISSSLLSDYDKLYEKFEFLRQNIGKEAYLAMLLNASRAGKVLWK